MNAQKSSQSALQKIAQIQKMERGKLSVIRESPSGPFYKLQAREQGKNVTQYVPRHQAAAVQEAIEGYQLFQELSAQHADEIIARTRAERAAGGSKKNSSRTSRSRRTPKSSS